MPDPLTCGGQIVTIGRSVHYTNLGDADGKYPPETQHAIITGLNEDGTVSLCVIYRTGFFFMPTCPYSDEPNRGHWNWPPRV
jgi:hypothetical protein